MFFMLFTEKCLMKTWKNALILFLSTLVLTILMPLNAFAEEINPLVISNAADLTMGVPADAVFTQVNQQIAFRFQPPSSGAYYFYALDCEKDGLAAGGAVYEAGALDVPLSEESGKEKGEKSFLIGPVDLQAGQSYYLVAEVVNRGGKTGSYKVGVGQKITITLDAQEGTIGDSHQVDLEAISGYGTIDRQEILVPDIESGEGFVCWKDSSGNSYDTELEFRPAASATLTANYAAKVQVHFTTTFGRYPGGTSDGKLDLSVGSGRTIFLKNYQLNLPDNSKRLISFKNTNTGTVYGLTDKVTIAEETSIEAQFENNPCVTFDANGGSFEDAEDSTAYVEPGSSLVLKRTVNPPSTDQMLTGWKGSDGKTYGPDGVIENVTSDLTMTAVWQPFYTVTLHSNDGTSNGTKGYFGTIGVQTISFRVIQGEAFKFDEEDGYIPPTWSDSSQKEFAEVYYDNPNIEIGQKVDMLHFVPECDITLYAGWNDLVSFTFLTGEGKFPDSFQNDYPENATPTSFKDVCIKGTTFQEVVHGIEKPVSNVAGRSFAGWYIDSNLSQKAEDDFFIERACTFYAKYAEPCTVTFNPVNGSEQGYFEDEADEDGKIRVSVPHGSKGMDEPEKPELDDKLRIFDHWVDAETNTVFDFENEIISGNRELKAVYADAYTVEMHPEPGYWEDDPDDTEIYSLKYKVGDGFALYDCPRPEKAGSIFRGWTTEEGNESKIIPETENEDAYSFINQKHVQPLYPIFSSADQNVPITLNAGEGYFDLEGNPKTVTAYADRKSTLAQIHAANIDNVSRGDEDRGEYWRLKGWMDSEGKAVDPKTEVPKSAATYTAEWVRQYEVEFDVNKEGVSIGSKKTLSVFSDVGESLLTGIVSDYSKTEILDGSVLDNIPAGEKFAGWYTKKKGGEKVDGNYKADQSVTKLTLYALYNEVENVSYGSITVDTVDQDGNKLPDMSFSLVKDQTAIAQYKGPEFTINTSDPEIFSLLPENQNGSEELYLQQTAKPDGYGTKSEVEKKHRVVISKTVKTGTDGKTVNYVIKIENQEKSYSIKNTKKTDTARVDDAVTVNVKDGNDAPLAGASFVLSTDKNGSTAVKNYSGDHFEISTADTELANYLPKGNGASRTLYFLQKSAPEGYEAEDAVYSVRIIVTKVETALDKEKDVFMTTTSYTMTADGQEEIEIVNEKGIHKVHNAVSVRVEDDAEKLLEDVEYGLFSDREGTTKLAGFDGAKFDISTALTGLKNILPAPDGDTTLYLIETKKPVGYEADQTVFEVALWTTSEETATATVITYNISVETESSLTILYKKKTEAETVHGSVTITSKGSDGAAPAATIGLYTDSQATQKIAEYSGANITVSTSEAALAGYLPEAGQVTSLYMKEITAPSGYEQDEDIYPVSISASAEEVKDDAADAFVTKTTYVMTVNGKKSLDIVHSKKEEPSVTPSGEPSVTPSGEPTGTPEEGGETPDSGDPIDVKPDDSGNGTGSGTTPTPAPTVNPSVTPTAKPTPVETLPTKGADGTPVGAGASAKAAAGAIAASNSDEGPKGTKYAPLRLRLKKATKNAITIRWNKVSGATQYIIFGNACGKGKKFKEIGRTGAFNFKVTKLADGKKLAKKKYYKFMVMAVKGSGNGQQVVSTSKTVHITTLGGAYNNYKSVKLNKTKVTLKKGKKFQIKAKAVKRGKKAKAHRKMSYESSNPAVATVSKKGKVKAKKKGTATIYCYAADGTYKKLKVKVK